jgi:isopentenyl-diphosphate delta-isomerase
MKKLIVVNRKDQILGQRGKLACHSLKGVLHRAFSVFIFNQKGEVLLQKRSRQKKLWPGFWSNACCSHPKPGETYVQAGERRLMEELGFTCQLKYLFKFYYRAVFENVGSENEICAVLVGQYNGQIKLNQEEAAAFKWIKASWLPRELEKNPNNYTPWFKLEVEKLIKKNLMIFEAKTEGISFKNI